MMVSIVSSDLLIFFLADFFGKLILFYCVLLTFFPVLPVGWLPWKILLPNCFIDREELKKKVNQIVVSSFPVVKYMNFGFLLYNSASLKVIEVHYGLLWYLIMMTVLLFVFLVFKTRSCSVWLDKLTEYPMNFH